MHPLIMSLAKAISEGDEVALVALKDYLLEETIEKPKEILYVINNGYENPDNEVYYMKMPIEYPVEDIRTIIEHKEDYDKQKIIEFWTIYPIGKDITTNELVSIVHFYELRNLKDKITKQLAKYYKDIL